MKVACYAHEAKGPELIGDCVVSLEDVLKKGEVDGEYHVQGASAQSLSPCRLV